MEQDYQVSIYIDNSTSIKTWKTSRAIISRRKPKNYGLQY